MNNHKPAIRGNKSSHRHNNALFLLSVLLLIAGTLLALASERAALEKQAHLMRAGVSTASSTSVPTPIVTMRRAHVHLYPFPSSNAGLMQPSVDTQGNVWVGEMYANRLAQLNPHTKGVTAWKPPHAQDGIMTTTIDAHGNVWFVEQGANYIGYFNQVQHRFHTFPLGTINGRPLGPQDLQFDSSGNLWFTAPAGGRIGRLDPTSGTIRTWPVPPAAAGIPSIPFSLTVISDTQVWFGNLAGGAIGHLNAVTGHITFHHLANTQAQVFSMAHDTRGRIWFTELLPGKLGLLDPATGKLTEFPVPASSGNLAVLYAVVVASNGDVWFADNTANALVRYSPGTYKYVFFQLSVPSSAPYGLTLDATGALWFTLSGPATNYVGEMTR